MAVSADAAPSSTLFHRGKHPVNSSSKGTDLPEAEETFVHKPTTIKGHGGHWKDLYQSTPLTISSRLPYHHPQNIAKSLIVCWCIIWHLILTGWPYCLVALCVSAFFYIPPRYLILALYSSLLVPRFKHTQRIVNVLDLYIFSYWRRYVSYRVTYEDSIQFDKQYVFAQFPHGAFPTAGQLHCSIFFKYHTRTIELLAANVLFTIPMWRHFMSVGGAVTASTAAFRQVLRDGKCASVHVGGIAEMFNCERDREVIVLSSRFGFVRMAVEHGVPLVPTYHFGNSQLIEFGPWWLRSVSRRLQMSLGIMCGRFGMPIPRQIPVWTVAGKPVEVGPPMRRDDPAFEMHVQSVHAHFMTAVQSLYETHRGQYWDGHKTWANRPLHII